jgi:hypothetical protein
MTTVELSEQQLETRRCAHTGQARAVSPSAQGCEECLAMGDTWVHLRICMSCGHVGCCDPGTLGLTYPDVGFMNENDYNGYVTLPTKC